MVGSCDVFEPVLDPPPTDQAPIDTSDWVPFLLPYYSSWGIRVPTLVASTQLIEAELRWIGDISGCITYYQASVEDEGDSIHVWLWGLEDTTRTCDSTTVRIDAAVRPMDTPHADDFSLVIHWADTTTIFPVEVRQASTDPEWVNFVPSYDGVPQWQYWSWSLVADESGNAWFGGENALIFIGDSTRRVSLADVGLTYIWFEDLALGPDGRLWGANYYAPQILIYDGSTWKTESFDHNGPRYVTSIDIDNNGVAWIGTTGKIFKYDEQNYVRVADPFIAFGLDEVAVDSLGALWFASHSSGIGKIVEDSVIVLFNSDNTPYNLNYDFYGSGIDNKLRFWANNGDAIYMSDGSTLTQVTEPLTGLAVDHISDIALDNEGGLWIATYGSGLVYYDNQGTTTVYNETNSGLLSNDIELVAVDGLGQVWTATNELGVTLFKNGR